jgi:hypothetical protein
VCLIHSTCKIERIKNMRCEENQEYVCFLMLIEITIQKYVFRQFRPITFYHTQ